ncbi:SDR family NAD(P)-dependent oxidoreductase [Spongiactinospora sp. TRM90649]|uniref:SDR family NAD(P)-dependent oxidoreductase n=1 Tax=Spongiactinospora sp. TRM90649 TaxID=3031114 RepID=UPI0023F98078|nr:SDR family NAD(P)-dependent oxidoreductase [Spongiactinospora sp. TRM90649]MDF5759164.1 SDR family NAD(P)-dependent oxidoreductase [Spongiactinospora sp. TRM90649]
MTASHGNEIMVVSGASTGIGAATARELAARGFHVLAGVRRERDGDAIRGDGVEPVILDLTRPEHVRALADRIASDPRHRPLRALVNNAAISVNAPAEVLPLDEWRRLFDVNLFGHIAITQALLPFLHRSHGRIVNISSVGGKIAMATYGAYAGAKFALEAVSDSLRRELAPHGVQVVVVEPGAVRSEMAGRGAATANDLAAMMNPEQRRRYGGLIEAVVAHSLAFTRNGLPSARAGAVIADAATVRRPRTRYTVGRDAALLTRLARFLPDRVLDRIAAANLRPYLPRQGT